MGRIISGVIGFIFTLAAGAIIAISLWAEDYWVTKTLAVLVFIAFIYAAYGVFKYLKQYGYLAVSEARRSNDVDYLKPTPYDTYRIYKAENIETETASYYPLIPKRIFIFGREILNLKTHKFLEVKFSKKDRSIAFKTEHFTLIVKNPSTIFDDPQYIKMPKGTGNSNY